MTDNKTNSQGIEFVPATCPNCGGELRVPSNRDVVKCLYCGIDIILHDHKKVIIETRIDSEKFYTLARQAETGGNYSEAYRYYTTILEHDIDNPWAWLGKGHTAGMLSTANQIRSDEALNAINKGISLAKSNIEETELNKILQEYYGNLSEHFSNLVDKTGQFPERDEEILYVNLKFLGKEYDILQKNPSSQLLAEQIKRIIILKIKLILAYIDFHFPKDRYQPEILVEKIRKPTVARIRAYLLSGKLNGDMYIEKILDDYVDEIQLMNKKQQTKKKNWIRKLFP